MRWGRRGDRSAREAAGVRRGERVLASVSSQTEVLVATDQALYLGAERHQWWEIERATWNPPLLVVNDRTGRQQEFTIDADSTLPAVVHAQIDASVVAHHRLDLGEGRWVTAVARRGTDGVVFWHLGFEPGTDADDPAVRLAAADALAALRESLGV